MAFNYSFPATRWVGVGDEEQLVKIIDEVFEVIDAVERGSKMDTLTEVFDVICACETLLRKYSPEEVAAAHAIVKGRNMLRGYFRN